MVAVLLARNPTDSVTSGLLPALVRAGLRVRVLTDDPAAHRVAYRDAGDAVVPTAVEVEGCEVTDVRSVLTRIGARPDAVISNSDHLQVQAALVADYLGLPGKDWRSAARARDKGLMRAGLQAAGLDDTACVRIPAGEPLPAATVVPAPGVLKPAEGVASEDVVLVRDRPDLERRLESIRARRTGDLLVEALLEGPLHTLETIGDGRTLRVWGGYRTRVSAEPHFVEERLTWAPDLPAGVLEAVLAQLSALGCGFGPCHTEFIVTADGPRLVEVNDRLIGDHCDFAMADLLGEPVFDDVVRVFLGGPPPVAGAEPAGRHGLVQWVLATQDGVLTGAPDPVGRTVGTACGGNVRLDYRPIRAVGTAVRVTGTNRDYLGSVRAVGPDDASVESVVDDFVRTGRWTIR